MSIELKIKSKHLALEPAIIRHEEQKLKKQIEWYKTKHQITSGGMFDHYKEHPDLYKLYSKKSELFSHRKINVRYEARATYLARAYIKGVPYKVVEAKSNDERLDYRVMDSLVRMVMKYGNTYYQPDYETDASGKIKILKTAEAKAKEYILAWMK